MSSVSWYFFSSPLCCPYMYFSVDLCLISQKPLVAAILHRCGWVLASSSGKPLQSFVFQENVNRFYFMYTSFLVSSCLMWSNLVSPLAHLNSLISAEFSLQSSLVFRLAPITGKYPYNDIIISTKGCLFTVGVRTLVFTE